MLSVVVTVRNRPQYLRECLEALLKQDLPGDQFEIIVVDDCSTDQTWNVCQQYGARQKPPRIWAYQTKERLGPGGARNLGNEMAAGEVLVVQDSDDISQGRRLSVIKEYFAAHPRVDIFFSGAMYVDRNLKPVRYHPASMGHVKILEHHQLIQHPTMAYRTLVIDGKKSGVDQKPRGAVKYPGEMADVDYGFLLEAKRHGYRFGCIDKDLVMYRNHPEQISRAQFGLQQKLANEKRQAIRQQMAGGEGAPASGQKIKGRGGKEVGGSNYKRKRMKRRK